MMTVPRSGPQGVRKALIVLTAYNAMTTAAAEAAGVEMLLVGDSGRMVELGYDLDAQRHDDDMVQSRQRRRRREALLVVDMPAVVPRGGPRRKCRRRREAAATA